MFNHVMFTKFPGKVSEGWWMVAMTVQPCSVICLTSRIKESDILESNPLVGSSNKRRLGFLQAKPRKYRHRHGDMDSVRVAHFIQWTSGAHYIQKSNCIWIGLYWFANAKWWAPTSTIRSTKWSALTQFYFYNMLSTSTHFGLVWQCQHRIYQLPALGSHIWEYGEVSQFQHCSPLVQKNCARLTPQWDSPILAARSPNNLYPLTGMILILAS